TLIDDPKYRRNILYMFAGVAVIEGIFAFLQTFNIQLSYSLYYYTEHTAYGLTQNSNYYGGLCVVMIAGISGMYIFSDLIAMPKLIKNSLTVILAVLFYTMLGSRARLAWVGFAGLLIFYIISMTIMYRRDREAVKPAVRRSLVLLAVFSAAFLIAFFFTDYIREAAVRSYWEVAIGDVDKIGTDRIYNWRMGLASVPDNWLTGVGLDNYGYVFESAPDIYFQAKAHNEYIHVLVTQGVPAFINYMALLVFACSGAVRNVIKDGSKERRTVTWILLGMFVTYCVQALFNGSVTYVAVYFWFIIGLITPRTAIRPDKNRLNSADL
ncbi:MAG: O-antigen ligase family protein, partial [Lachnospiraceae bacterium]